jgi:hypothetical protein
VCGKRQLHEGQQLNSVNENAAEAIGRTSAAIAVSNDEIISSAVSHTLRIRGQEGRI